MPADWFALKRLGMDHLKADDHVKMLFFKASVIGTAEWYIRLRESILRAIGLWKLAAWEQADAPEVRRAT